MEVSKLLRSACSAMTVAVKTTPTAAKVLLEVPALHVMMAMEAHEDI
jgi:hypothetical protein